MPGSDQGLTSGGRSAAARRSQAASASSTSSAKRSAQFLPPLRLQPAGIRSSARKPASRAASSSRIKPAWIVLPRPDRIGHQHAGDAVTDHRQQRLELMRRASAPPRVPPRSSPQTGSPPPRAPEDVQETARMDRSNAHRRAGRRRAIERSQDRERGAPRRGQPQLSGRRPRDEIPERPALAADAKVIADLPDGGSMLLLGSVTQAFGRAFEPCAGTAGRRTQLVEQYAIGRTGGAGGEEAADTNGMIRICDPDHRRHRGYCG